MSSRKKVLISGAGVAGIVSAILLDKDKYDVEIIEQAAAFRNIGFSIVLWKSGFVLLKKLLGANGVTLQEGKDCFPIKNFVIYGNEKLEKIKTLDSQGYAWSFEREHLMQMLENVLLKKVSSNNIKFSTRIKEIIQNSNGTTVKFENNFVNKYDLIIISEGINSNSRSIIFPGERIVNLNYVLRYAWFSKPTDLKNDAALFFTQGHLGVIHPPYFKNLLGFYFKKDSSLEDQHRFEQHVLRIIQDPLGENTAINLKTSKIFDLKEVYLQSYVRGNIALIGDAAHGRPPTLGFGTSLAIEDAFYLSNLIRDSKELSHFNQRRKRIENIYNFQRFVEGLMTSNATMTKLLTIFIKFLFGNYLSRKMKKLASYNIFKD